MENRIQKDLMSAMREKNEERLNALRAIKTAIMQVKTSPNFEGDRNAPLPDSNVLKLMQKMVKERMESFEIYKNAGRDDLASKEEGEANIIKLYLPQPLSNEEIEAIVNDAINETGATSMKEMGKVMKLATSKVNGRAEGKVLSMVIKKLLTNG